MLRVGLTGGVGSGKSTVAATLRELGASVSRSDEIGRAMMQPGQTVYAAIAAHFGPDVVRPDGSLDRAALARLAFQNGRVDELNRIVHPAVIAAQGAWMESVGRQNPGAVAVVESALLLETRYGPTGERQAGDSPWRTRFDRIVLVTAPLELRLERYLLRENASEEGERREAVLRDARARLASQISDEQKAAMSDYIVSNDASPSHLRTQVEQLYLTLKAEAADRSDEAM